MNNSRGKNEEHSKKLGQFDRVAFKQSGERLFDSLFEFDRELMDTMAYANAQKNGSLEERIEMESSVQKKTIPEYQRNPIEESSEQGLQSCTSRGTLQTLLTSTFMTMWTTRLCMAGNGAGRNRGMDGKSV